MGEVRLSCNKQTAYMFAGGWSEKEFIKNHTPQIIHFKFLALEFGERKLIQEYPLNNKHMDNF